MSNPNKTGNAAWMVVIFFLMVGCGCSQGPADSVAATTHPASETATSDLPPYVECNGTLQPGKRFLIRLGAGERVSDILVAREQTVEKNQPLAQLTNDSLRQQIMALEEKQFDVWKEKANLKLLAIEIENNENQEKGLKNMIAEERRIGEKIPGYQPDRQIRQWQEKLNQTEYQLRLLTERLAIQEQSYAQQHERIVHQQNLLADLKRHAERLLVLAPFKGSVRNIHPSAETAAPGEVVLEVWDESFYTVRAYLWQNQVVNVQPGNRVEVFPDFYQNVALAGSVQSVLPGDLSPDDGRFPKFPVMVKIQKHDQRLVIGMTVSLRIYIEGPGQPKGAS